LSCKTVAMSRMFGLARMTVWAFGFSVTFGDNIAALALVKDDGMEPTLKRGDIVLVDKVSLRHLNAGHVVQMRNPEAERGASDLRLVRRVDFAPDVRYARFRFVKDNAQSDARDSQDFGHCPDAVITGKLVAVVFPPWRATMLDSAVRWRVSDS
jgi:hypothetical protein